MPQGPDIDRLGWIADPEAEIATWSAMIVPIRFGAGTRVKIAEGFSRRCPIVSTHIGAYGYDVRDGEQLCLADTAEDFAAACIRLMQSPREGEAIGERGWREFMQKWTWDAIAPNVWAAAQDCLSRTQRSRVQGAAAEGDRQRRTQPVY
jgi:glycosyltransferase involved in cell wall biosynthesis